MLFLGRGNEGASRICKAQEYCVKRSSLIALNISSQISSEIYSSPKISYESFISCIRTNFSVQRACFEAISTWLCMLIRLCFDLRPAIRNIQHVISSFGRFWYFNLEMSKWTIIIWEKCNTYLFVPYVLLPD